MEIMVTWHGEQFNVELASSKGSEAFLSVKGCRIVDGAKGSFVSWPATKNEKTGKWWSHVWANDRFAAAVLQKAQESRPAPSRPGRRSGGGGDDEDIPFADPLKGRLSLVQ